MLQVGEGSHPCSIVNLSSGGVCLRLQKALPPASAQACRLRLLADGTDQAEDLPIQLRWSEAGPDGLIAGFEFSGSEAEAAEAILSCLGHPHTQKDQLTGVEWL